MNNRLWGAVVVIVFGYVLGFYFQRRGIAHLDRRLDDLRAEMNARFAEFIHRFDDLIERCKLE